MSNNMTHDNISIKPLPIGIICSNAYFTTITFPEITMVSCRKLTM